MPVVRLLPGNMDYIIQIMQIIQMRKTSALKDVDHDVGFNNVDNDQSCTC